MSTDPYARPTDPYAAPKAAVVDTAVAVDAEYIPGGQALGAGAGWDWIAAGWQLFMKQPMMWIGFFIVFILIFTVSGLIPVAGGIATVIFSPVMTAGLMIACRKLEEGEDLKLDYMFAGFRGNKFGPLVIVGALYLAGTFAIVIAVALVFGLGLGAGALTGLFKGGGGAEVGLYVGLAIALFVLLVLALFLPLVMALWYAPPLVVFHDREPAAALKESFSGCLRNIIPFLVYSVIGLVLMLLATLPLMLGWLVLGPVIMGSYYASYRGIFTRTGSGS
jgi:uncharacterized membrane protein